MDLAPVSLHLTSHPVHFILFTPSPVPASCLSHIFSQTKARHNKAYTSQHQIFFLVPVRNASFTSQADQTILWRERETPGVMQKRSLKYVLRSISRIKLKARQEKKIHPNLANMRFATNKFWAHISKTEQQNGNHTPHLKRLVG